MTLLMQKIDFRFLKDSIHSTTKTWEKLKKADSGLKVRWVSQLKWRARFLSYPCDDAWCVPPVWFALVPWTQCVNSVQNHYLPYLLLCIFNLICKTHIESKDDQHCGKTLIWLYGKTQNLVRDVSLNIRSEWPLS